MKWIITAALSLGAMSFPTIAKAEVPDHIETVNPRLNLMMVALPLTSNEVSRIRRDTAANFVVTGCPVEIWIDKASKKPVFAKAVCTTGDGDIPENESIRFVKVRP